MAYDTNSFSIAHYILLICVIVLCGGLVAYAMVHDTGRHADDALPMPVVAPVATPRSDEAECAQTVTNAVAQMWAYNPDAIPVKYKDAAMAYYTGPVQYTVRGDCNGTKFVCRAGTPRADCDPCAAGSARDYALSLQTRDMIQKHCGQ